LRKGPFPPPQTPPLFSKPFTGIYLFAEQKDKCHSNFEKYLNAQVYMSFFTTYPHWEQSYFFSIIYPYWEQNIFFFELIMLKKFAICRLKS